MNKEEYKDYLKLSGKITEKLDNTATYENWLIIQEYIDRAQQKVEQLEKENEHLRTQVNAYENPNDLTLFYMWLDEKAKDKIKQLENIRKKAIEFINEWLFEAGGNGADMDYDTIVDLLNILNKGE